MVDRVIGVLKLDSNTFEEIEADTTATSQAAIIVLIVAIISGVGAGVLGDNFIGAMLSTVISTFVGWVVWSAVTWFVGTNLFEGKADLNEMLRVIGFAYSPQILSFIPCVGILTFFWTLAAGFVAVRQGLDLDNTKAFLTVAIGFVVVLAISFAIGLIFGITAFGIGAITGG